MGALYATIPICAENTYIPYLATGIVALSLSRSDSARAMVECIERSGHDLTRPAVGERNVTTSPLAFTSVPLFF
ncbi:hypothetical protein RSOLAG1IB_01633 [Rhizoctonia solani AG-1 IB]|uniref:Uncharacterized protein n=1 Tax=Thanatephorus cucumeris (strain AG1-IB / isolate 7/3/14) TaxID=1108050 RepID=A0A0B7FC83_THACB|nr:hypothetical protein RSOLAG1IB_01633 [Rhizoctonia solani AG-1 IB]